VVSGRSKKAGTRKGSGLFHFHEMPHDRLYIASANGMQTVKRR
jgi:hypothetical protein